jgi:hypothetical protein
VHDVLNSDTPSDTTSCTLVRRAHLGVHLAAVVVVDHAQPQVAVDLGLGGWLSARGLWRLGAGRPIRRPVPPAPPAQRPGPPGPPSARSPREPGRTGAEGGLLLRQPLLLTRRSGDPALHRLPLSRLRQGRPVSKQERVDRGLDPGRREETEQPVLQGRSDVTFLDLDGARVRHVAQTRTASLARQRYYTWP